MVYIYFLEKNNIPFYIGYTKNLKQRLNAHRRKYGIETEMVELDLIDNKDKKQSESFYIQLFKSWGFRLLNQNEGGGGPKFKTEESIQKYKGWRQGKKPMLGKKQSEITKKRKSAALKGKPKPEGFGEMMRQVRQGVPKPKGMGKKVSENRNHKKAAENQQKPILQFSLDNILIKEWPSIKHAAEGTNSNASTISKVCRGILKTTNGFIWKFK
jgi:predicted GIY-YIG superfamily endonuclease